jgi:3-hydroxybutyryl-CoA dehydrogenase
MSETRKASTVSNIKFVSELDFCIADICIEAITEKKQPKIDLFGNLAEINSSESIFATNTSSLSVTDIARELPNPERVAGLHFFNPATIMKLVEVVSTSFTSQKVINTLLSFIKSLDKVAVTCKDSPGFIVNRVARPFYIEALRLVEETYTSIDQADKLLESAGFKMGPFRLMDLIGNDINYAVSCSVYEQLGSPERLKPSPIQENLVATNKLGRKNGEGYYQY